MIKVALCLVLVISSTLLGNWFSERLISRRNTLELMINSLTKMKTLISFGGYEIHHVVQDSFIGFPDFIKEFDTSENCLNFAEFWNKCVDSIPDRYGLTSDDKKILRNFAEGLGVSDTDGQLSNCNLYCDLLREQLEKAKEKEKNSGKLYRVLGFSLGCVVTLMIV